MGERKVDVQVTFPSGVELDLTASTLLAHVDEHPISATGHSAVTLVGAGRLLGVVLDEDGKPILLGYVTDASTEISVATTVEAALFFALGMYAQPVEVQEAFWEHVRGFSLFPHTVEEAEALFLDDVHFLQGEAFLEAMRTFLQSVEGDIFLAQKIDIVNNHVRSGLQLEEMPGDKVRVINTLRRRCHAFLYKLASTDEFDVETILVGDVAAENPAPRGESAVGPVSVFDSFLGTVQGGAAGKGIEFFRTESDPLDVALVPGEEEARFVVRVVGASADDQYDGLNAAEFQKRVDLQLETFALDILLPILFKLADQEDFLKELKSNDDLKALGKLALDTVKQLPGLRDPISKGDFRGALKSLREGLVAGTLTDALQPLTERLIRYHGTRRGIKGDELEEFVKQNPLTKWLEITNTLLEINEYRRLVMALFEGGPLEEFEITSSRSKVTLSPQYGVVTQGDKLGFKAVVQDAAIEGAAFEYTWSTTGQYGELRDALGKSGTSFVSSQDEVEFHAPFGVSLPVGEQAVDIVQVSVALKQGTMTTPVGKSVAAAEVRELALEIVPPDAELQGGENLTLRLQWTDGGNPFTSPHYDYKLVWETPGNFGLFNAASTSHTSTTSDTVVYACLEEKAEGTEEVTARLYARPKGDSTPFRFVDQMRTDIHVRNDPKTKIFYVPRFTYTNILPGFVLGVEDGMSFRQAFRVPPVPNAVRYSIEIVTWRWGRENWVGRSARWDADSTQMQDPRDADSFVWFLHIGSQSSGTDIPRLAAFYAEATGLAKVTVTLAD